MGKFDSKNKGSQVDVYQLIAERNAASSAPRQAAQPQQPVEQPVPQQPAQPEPAPQPTVERDSLGVPAFLRRPTRK